MAYVKPTVADFTTRFPIFADKDENLIQQLLDEAANTVDESWREVDYRPAIMYLTAHNLALDNSGEGEDVAFGQPGAISSESFGGMSISYSGTPGSGDAAASSTFGQTSYGRSFYRLLKLNKTGPVVV